LDSIFFYMNKTAFFIWLLLVFILSCTNKKQNKTIASTSKLNTITVVIDNRLWDGIIGDSLRNKLASPVEGLSTEEPLFDVVQYEDHLLEGFVSNKRTIIIVEKGKPNQFFIKKNQFATPQIIIYISGKSNADIIRIIEANTATIIQVINEVELKHHQLLLKDSLRNSNDLKKQFQLSLNIPQNYKYVDNETHFVWLKNDLMNGSTNLLIAQLPLQRIKKARDLELQLVKIYDSIGNLHVKGKMPESTMFIDQSYPIYFSKLLIDQKVAYELKGTWRIKNSYMRGPFLCYLLNDPKNKRTVFLNGFCYFPSKEERDFRHELESIFKGVHLN